MELAGSCQESIALVKSGQNKSLNKELCCMFRKKGTGVSLKKKLSVDFILKLYIGTKARFCIHTSTPEPAQNILL